MTTDDDRIAYLAGETSGERLDEPERAELDEVRSLLADPSTWAEPPADLEASVVAAVGEAARPLASRPTPRRTRRPALGLVGVAAAVVALVALVGPGGEPTNLEAVLVGTELAPGAEGQAVLTKTDAGWRIELDATGLPRLDDGRFYQAWLKPDDGEAVPIGTFNEPDGVVLWAGVSPKEYPTLTVTAESASDGTAASGDRVLGGPVTEP